MEFTVEMLNRAAQIAPVLRMLMLNDGKSTVKFLRCEKSLSSGMNIPRPTVEYEKILGKNTLVLKENAAEDEIVSAYHDFKNENGIPSVIFASDAGIFTCGQSPAEADYIGQTYCAAVTYDEKKSIPVAGTQSFAIPTGRLAGKVAIVTGGAQGFGKGIAEALSKEGAYVVIADMNYDGAKATASEFADAIAVKANVSDEISVEEMIRETVLNYGGLDIFVNNAGIVRAGSLEEMTKSNFELVTSVNYTAYFLCVKYASAVMKIQHKAAPDKMFDIIEINSKSGLAGSNKNFAYAGSKFGGIGLTQSFAMELAPYNIKVNAVCPGNFLEGPLWTDPEKGLLVQYLKAGKVPGAKTTADVLKFYESKVPLGRGCRTIDVARAIFYICEQDYETGQAIPVTGGQEMLK